MIAFGGGCIIRIHDQSIVGFLKYPSYLLRDTTRDTGAKAPAQAKAATIIVALNIFKIRISSDLSCKLLQQQIPNCKRDLVELFLIFSTCVRLG